MEGTLFAPQRKRKPSSENTGEKSNQPKTKRKGKKKRKEEEKYIYMKKRKKKKRKEISPIEESREGVSKLKKNETT